MTAVYVAIYSCWDRRSRKERAVVFTFLVYFVSEIKQR